MQYKVVINNIEYTHEDIRSGHIEEPLFDDLSIGNACEAMFELEFKPKGDIPRMAALKPYVYEDDTWKALKTFYIDERDYSPITGIMYVVAYDLMLKADIIWAPSQTLEFPMTMQEAATVIASEMGISLDSRCSFTSGFEVDYPANDYTLRDVLGYIATANGANWIITDADQLLLVPLRDSMPEPTHYLVTEHGNPIVFANKRILV